MAKLKVADRSDNFVCLTVQTAPSGFYWDVFYLDADGEEAILWSNPVRKLRKHYNQVLQDFGVYGKEEPLVVQLAALCRNHGATKSTTVASFETADEMAEWMSSTMVDLFHDVVNKISIEKTDNLPKSDSDQLKE